MKNYPLRRREEEGKPKGPHLLRGWQLGCGTAGEGLHGMGDGAVVFPEPAEGGGTLEEGFRM